MNKLAKKEVDYYGDGLCPLELWIGFERDVLEVLKDIPDVREAFIVYGFYDIIIQVEADTVGDLTELIREIRQMEKVRSTLSMIVI